MEQDPSQRFREKSATILAKLAHAEDLNDLIDMKLDGIEAGIAELAQRIPENPDTYTTNT